MEWLVLHGLSSNATQPPTSARSIIFLVCTRPEQPTPSSSDCAFFLFFAVVLKLGVMYVHNSGLPLDDTDEPIEIRCEWLASKLDNHYFPTEISTVVLKRPTNSM